MTVVCYRDGVIAADSISVDGSNTIQCRVRKIVRHRGWLAGAGGPASGAAVFLRWVESGMQESLGCICKDDMEALLVSPDGEVRYYDNSGEWYRATGPFHAIGIGSPLAMVAMDYGASAIEAVRVAIKYNVYCGGPIVSERLGRMRRRVRVARKG